MTQRSNEPSTVDEQATLKDDDLTQFLQHAELTEVRFTRVSGSLASEEISEIVGLSQTVTSQVRLRIDGFDCRFDSEILALDEDRETRATFVIDTVSSFSFPEHAAEDGFYEQMDGPSQGLIQQFAQQVAYFVAFPYIRETLQSLSSRLGLGSLTLGLLRVDGGPTSFTAQHAIGFDRPGTQD